LICAAAPVTASAAAAASRTLCIDSFMVRVSL